MVGKGDVHQLLQAEVPLGPHIPETLLICAGNASEPTGHGIFDPRPNIFTDEFVLVLGND